MCIRDRAQGNAEVRGLAETLNALVAQREQLRSEIGQRVAEGSRRVEQERSRLAALMSELTQSVVVCNLDGRVLLYNNRARLQFKALSDAPALAGGAELIGLGRSIYTVFDRQLVAHALENIQQRLQRGAATPSAQFVTVTKSGQLLRAIMAPVREGEATDSPLGGFVLMLDNITRDYERDSAQDQLLQGLTEGSRASLGNLQAAVEEADIVTCATISSNPIVSGDWLKPGAHLDLVGGYTPAMREADDVAVRRASLFVDTRTGGLKEAGDIVDPIRRGIIAEGDVKADLFDLATAPPFPALAAQASNPPPGRQRGRHNHPLPPALGVRGAALAGGAAAQRATGSVLGGISPVGQTKALPTVLDDGALNYETILVSGGRRGFDVEVAPADLVRICRATVAPISRTR